MHTLNTFFEDLSYFNYMRVHTYTFPQSLGKALNLLEMELRAVVSHPIWILGTELGLSARAVHPLEH